MNFLVMGNWRARTLGHIGASLAREVICHAIYLGTVEIGTENNIYYIMTVSSSASLTGYLIAKCEK